MMFVKIDIDKKQFEKQLGDMDIKMPSIAKKMMNKVNTLIKKEARKTMRARKFDKSKETGIYKNLYSISKKNFEAIVGIKKIAFYSVFVERGAHIKVKNSEYLTFKINDKFVRVKSVTIQAKPFLKPAIDMFWNTGKANKEMEAVFQKELDKLFNKG
ncbi:hypothetical protein [Treponema denticola]|uniref:hypothetical protein n=1 Tax=Treponema denticola TaxID=158 RepID=UPI0020A5EFEA|nr:hypothetical protein [Treponema denticola]UTC86871.1 hypothetical protein E4N79_01395 [Treponema denticola]